MMFGETEDGMFIFQATPEEFEGMGTLMLEAAQGEPGSRHNGGQFWDEDGFKPIVMMVIDNGPRESDA